MPKKGKAQNANGGKKAKDEDVDAILAELALEDSKTAKMAQCREAPCDRPYAPHPSRKCRRAGPRGFRADRSPLPGGVRPAPLAHQSHEMTLDLRAQVAAGACNADVRRRRPGKRPTASRHHGRPRGGSGRGKMLRAGYARVRRPR
jgi:hypothetical protein